MEYKLSTPLTPSTPTKDKPNTIQQEAGNFYNPDQPLNSGNRVDLSLMLYSVNRKQSKRRATRECFCFYLPYLFLILTWVLFSQSIFDGFHMNESLKNAVLRKKDYSLEVDKAFSNIENTEEYWKWTQDVLIPELFNEVGFDGNKLDPSSWRYIGNANKLIGSLRFRQIRVTNTSCTNMYPTYGIHGGNDTQEYDNACFTDYDINSPSSVSKESFGPNDRFVYKSCVENRGGETYYSKQNTYGCDGHSVFLPFSTSLTNAKDFVAQMKLDGWIDKSTRASFVEFFTYNANLNYFVQAKMVIDVTNGGGFGTSWAFRVFKLEVLRTPTDYILFTFNLILPIFVLYKTYILIDTLTTAYRIDKSWRVIFKFFSFWNILDAINILLFCVSFILRLLFHTNPDRIKFQITEEMYPQLDFVAFVYNLDIIINSASVILAFFIFYKYFEVLEKFNILIRTIEFAKWTLVSVGIILGICILGFSMSGYLMYGMKLEDFRDLPTTVMTLLRLLLNDFSYAAIRQENRTFSAPYYIFYVAIAFFLILNMFLAVITYYFGEVVDEQQEKEGEGEYIFNIIKTVFKFFLGLAKSVFDAIITSLRPKRSDMKKKVEHIRNAKFDHGDDRMLEKLSDLYKKKGADLTKEDLYLVVGSEADPEIIEGIMKRLDMDGDGTISIDEIKMRKAQDNIDLQQINEQQEIIHKKERIRQATKMSITSRVFLDDKETNLVIKGKLKAIEKDLDEIVNMAMELKERGLL